MNRIRSLGVVFALGGALLAAPKAHAWVAVRGGVGVGVGVAAGAVAGAAVASAASRPTYVAPPPTTVVVAAPPSGAVTTLPAGCQTAANGVYQCGSTRYQAAVSGGSVTYQVIP